MTINTITIKEAAGKVLLLFYYEQRVDPSSLMDTPLSFQMRHFENQDQKGPLLSLDGTLSETLRKTGLSDVDIYNAINYLYDKDFITFTTSNDGTDDPFLSIRLLDGGFDIIEAIERGEDEKRQFNVIFNIKVENNVNVDSLIKANLGSIFGIGLNG